MSKLTEMFSNTVGSLDKQFRRKRGRLPRFRAPDPLPQIPEDAFLEDLPAVADIGKVLRSTAEDERKVEKEREEAAKWPWERDEEDEEEEE